MISYHSHHFGSIRMVHIQSFFAVRGILTAMVDWWRCEVQCLYDKVSKQHRRLYELLPSQLAMFRDRKMRDMAGHRQHDDMVVASRR
jgi:hypothetical protein